jgi:alpha-amylase
MNNPEVVKELIEWTIWFINETGIDGLRLDAVKHISATFFRDYLYTVRERTGKNLFAVGEYYSNDVNDLMWYLQATDYQMSLFAFALRNKFTQACRTPGYDLRNLMDDTLAVRCPVNAVSFVDNHDVQPLREAHDSYVEFWFRMHS